MRMARKKLTSKQHAQRKYAARMRTLRTRASRTRGGKGPMAKRSQARALRRKLGLGKPRSLTVKQWAQRKYAARMRVVRSRASTTRGGKGPVYERTAARVLRRNLRVRRR